MQKTYNYTMHVLPELWCPDPALLNIVYLFKCIKGSMSTDSNLFIFPIKA